MTFFLSYIIMFNSHALYQKGFQLALTLYYIHALNLPEVPTCFTIPIYARICMTKNSLGVPTCFTFPIYARLHAFLSASQFFLRIYRLLKALWHHSLYSTVHILVFQNNLAPLAPFTLQVPVHILVFQNNLAPLTAYKP